MACEKHGHEDTTVSLRPLSFEEAMKELSSIPKREGPQHQELGNTTEDAPQSVPSKKQTSRHRLSSER